MAYRTHCLPPRLRLELAWQAYQQQGLYGAITDLARSFGVSRWLVYHLLHVVVPVLLAVATPSVRVPSLCPGGWRWTSVIWIERL